MSAPDPVAVALLHCRDRLIEARGHAALAVRVSGRATGYRDPTGERATSCMWLVTAIEAVLHDVDRFTSRPSTDWEVE